MLYLDFLINWAVLCNLSEICSDASIFTSESSFILHLSFLYGLECPLLQLVIGVGQFWSLLSWYVCIGELHNFSCLIYVSCFEVSIGVYSCLNVLPMDMFLQHCSCVYMSVVIMLWFVCKLLCLGGILGSCPLLFWLENCLLPISYMMFLFLFVFIYRFWSTGGTFMFVSNLACSLATFTFSVIFCCLMFVFRIFLFCYTFLYFMLLLLCNILVHALNSLWHILVVV